MGAQQSVGSILQELHPQAVTAFVGVTVFSLLVTVAIIYLAVQSDRIRGLRTVAAAFAFNSLRLMAVLAGAWIGREHALFGTNLFNTLASVFLIAGGLRMAGRRVPVPQLVTLAAAGIGVAAWGAYGAMPVAARTVSMTMLGAFSYFVFAWGLYQVARNAVFQGYLVVSVLAVLYGLLRLAGPYLSPSGDNQVIGLLAVSSLYLATALSLIIALQRSQFLEAREARRRAESVGQQSQAAIDSTTDLMGLLRVEPDGRLIIEMVNPAFSAFTRAAYPHHKVQNFVGRDMVDVMRNEYRIPTSEADALLEIYREAIRTGAPQQSVARHGNRVREAVITPLLDGGGKVTHVFYRGTDVTEIQRAQDAARSSTERLATVFKVSPTPLVVAASDDGRLLEVNDAWLRARNRRREDVIGRNVSELDLWLESADRDRFLEALRRDGRVNNFVTRVRRGSGEIADVALSAELIDWDGVPARLVSSHDITELEKARREAQAARERLEAILEHSPVAISITRFADGNMLYVNPAWSRQTGFTRAEALGRTSTEAGIWPNEQARNEGMLGKLDSGESAHFGRSFRNNLGRDLHVLVSALAIEYQGERCVLAISQDITESEVNRRRAGEATERLARVFNLSPAPMIVTTLTDGAVLEVNDAWLAFYRGKREHLIGRTTLQIEHWADAADRQRFVEGLRNHKRVNNFFTRFRRRDGSIADCILNAEIIDWDGSEAILGSLQDVTEMRRVNETLERRVRERTAELEQTLDELEAFSYSVSHDLRAPLRAMSSFASLLAARPSVAADAQAGSHAQRITRAAVRMAQIVNELLRYSRLARQPIERQPFALGEEVRALARELDEQSEGQRIRWDIGELPGLRGDPTLLRLVLQNLLDNAAKYSRPRDEAVISVRAREEKGFVEVSVCDNGVGFDMEHAANLFRPFQRLHDERDFEGTGIGLAHAKRIVERHGGRIWAQAAPGQGATFRFTVPR